MLKACLSPSQDSQASAECVCVCVCVCERVSEGMTVVLNVIYISLLIIPCIIYYVTNKETLNVWDKVWKESIDLGEKVKMLRLVLGEWMEIGERLIF